jgi:hypothetical protein
MILSLLITLHFAGIATACLAAPPTPWLVLQLWTRVFRPYLEFMYLNNAYHFYAPEPGPASYLWFRVIFEAPDESEHGRWYKVPHVDENGQVDHTVALEYQRFLALTESVTTGTPPPVPIHVDPQGVVSARVEPPLYGNRLRLLPGKRAEQTHLILQAIAAQGVVSPGTGSPIFPQVAVSLGVAGFDVSALGKRDPDNVVLGQQTFDRFRIPLHPDPALADLRQQVTLPSDSSRRMLSAYVRFVARKFAVDPDDASRTFKSVKVYRVIHIIPPPTLLKEGWSATDPELYRPYYLGNFRGDGSLVPFDRNDPYRGWLLPILREYPNDPNSKIRDFARMHAGDPNWVRPRIQPQQPAVVPEWGPPDKQDLELIQP